MPGGEPDGNAHEEGPQAAIAHRNLERLAAWERKTSTVIVVAAVLPIAVGLTKAHRDSTTPTVWLDLISWAIFLVDYVVHLRLKPRYLRSRVGLFDLTIVLLTAPWYLLTGATGSRVLSLARLGRLGRAFVATGHSRKLRDLGRRLGQAAAYGATLVVVCALVVEAVEPPSSGFANFQDSIWWAIVTFTTVGYGDLYPVTGAGRLAAVFLMLGGVALIGSLAASLGSFLQKNSAAEELEAEAGDDPDAESEDGDDAPPPLHLRELHDTQVALLEEVRELRAEIAALRSEPPDGGVTH